MSMMKLTRLCFALILLTVAGTASAEKKPYPKSLPHENSIVDGYRGIWYTIKQGHEYGDKYSGGLGTYTMKHIPMAV